MGKETPRVEWTFLEDETEWPALPSAPGGRSRDEEPSPMYQAEYRLAALVVVLAMLLAGVWGWRRQIQATARVAQLQTTVAGEEVPPALAAGMPSLPKAQLVDQEFIRGDLVMAQVTVRESGEGDISTYRETRFYQRTAGGWQRVKANPEWLGPVQSLQTAHFNIRYRTVDAAAVAQAAPRLDRLYERIHRDYGLHAAGTEPDIVVEVVVDAPLIRYSHAEHTLTVLSPATLSVPVEITPATVIYQAAVYPLAQLVMADLLERYPAERRQNTVFRQSLMYALPLWVVWDDDGPLAVWQDDVVRWLYENTKTGPVHPFQAIPPSYVELCRTYGLWGLSPMDTSIPLDCPVGSERLTRGAYSLLPLRLGDLVYVQPESVYVPVSSVQYVALATAVDYVVATYGRDMLPQWLAAVGDHASWKSLAPEIFGVSAKEFETGWHAYLEETYGAGETNNRSRDR